VSAADEGIAHLRAADAVLAAVIDGVGTLPADEDDAASRERPDDHYGALVRSIVGQQLSTKAASAIYRRLTARFDGRTPTPEQVLADDPEELRAAAGLSRMKVSFLRSLAEHVHDGSIELERIAELDDDAIITELTTVKGIGEWSAHMYLMFHLRRPDVLAWGDLGVRRAVQRVYGLDDPPLRDELTALAEPWRPHRTLACRYLWGSLDATPA
jgi:DNA-3-methyladenine glycosylase II